MCCDRFSNLSLLVTKYLLPHTQNSDCSSPRERIQFPPATCLVPSQSYTLISQECVVPSVQHRYGLSWFGNLDPQMYSLSHGRVGAKEQQ